MTGSVSLFILLCSLLKRPCSLCSGHYVMMMMMMMMVGLYGNICNAILDNTRFYLDNSSQFKST